MKEEETLSGTSGWTPMGWAFHAGESVSDSRRSETARPTWRSSELFSVTVAPAQAVPSDADQSDRRIACSPPT